MALKEKKSIGEFLVGLGMITQDQLAKAQEEARKRGERLEQTLVKLEYVDEEVLTKALADSYYHLPYVDLDNYLIDPAVTDLIPESLARKYKVMPIFKVGEILSVAVVNPVNILTLDEVRKKAQCDVEVVISNESKIVRAIGKYYGTDNSLGDTLKFYKEDSNLSESKEIKVKKGHQLAVEEIDQKGIGESIEEAPVVKLLDLIFMHAIRDRASDIHFEPDENYLNVRFRIDGLLHEAVTLPRKIHSSVTSRIKVMAEMDIAETRSPQDGHFMLSVGDREFEIRVSTFPTIYGENLVLRVLDQTSTLLGLDELGFSPQNLERYSTLIKKPYGIILVTGPTGSGKTTTLYTSLNMINSPSKNIITIEDPVEYRLKLIRQTQVNPKAGITFASGIRSILRQDPDIIMIGEIRDGETSKIAIQAALTGHLVFSTLHTNDAAEALTRLRDMGVQPYLIASSVIGVVAQRLVRRICSHCKEAYHPGEEEIRAILGQEDEADVPELYRGKGCSRCKGTGYSGRMGIFELLVVNDEIRELISKDGTIKVIKEMARSTLNMKTFREDGLEKVLMGLTSLEEVDRVTSVDGV